MTQTENPKPPAPNTKTKPPCHIHDNVGSWEVKDIRANVCVNNEDFIEYKGIHYCLFHLPTKDKDIQRFEKSFRNRLEKVRQNLAEIEKLPEEEQVKAKAELRYDFRYVFFPSELDLSNYKFEVAADFSSATFSADAYFSSATFSADASFSSAIFSGNAYFYEVMFSGKANFDDAFFQRKENLVNFSSSSFILSARFQKVVFESKPYFVRTIFYSSVDFKFSTFSESSDLRFSTDNFKGDVSFRSVYLKGYLFFEKSDNEDTNLTPITNMDFSYLLAEKPERIVFRNVLLKPSWFVGLDSRKIVFSLVDWENIKDGNSGIQREVKSVAEKNKGDLQLSYRLLAETLFNLASNSEENNRFAQASNFRKSALECERLERLYRQKTKWNEFKQHWGKHIICRQFFSEAKKTLTESGKLLWKAPIDFVHYLYRYLSGYGEKWFRAFCWLLVIWFAFAVIYYFAQGFVGDNKLGFGDSIGYSLQVMTLQRPEPRPEAGLTRVIYGMETIFAPLQAALLALAIRRKFMR